ncbi:hypothetical protein ACFLZ7_00695 [Nanoarchaeota archaeon]
MDYDQRRVFEGRERGDITTIVREAEKILGDPLVWEVKRTVNKAYSKKAYHNGDATVVLEHNSGDSDPLHGYHLYIEIYGNPSDKFQSYLDKKVEEREKTKSSGSQN